MSNEYEAKTPPLFDIKPPLELSKTNPAGMDSDPNVMAARERAIKAQEDLYSDLEKRYEKPNWFKIAGAFAKPQLGGFMASLGSAADVMGEQTEAQRAMVPSLSRMKAEIEASKIPFSQRVAQKNLMEEWRKTGRPMDSNTYQKILELGTDSDIAKSAKGYYEAAEKGLGLTTAATEAAMKYPALQGAMDQYIDFQLNPNTDPKKIEEQKIKVRQSLEASKPPQIAKEQWDQMSDLDKMNISSQYANKQLEAGMSVEEKMRTNAEAVPERLSSLRTIRELALGEGIPDIKDNQGKIVKTGQQQMADALNVFGTENPMDVIGRAVSEGAGPEVLRRLDDRLRQANMNEATRDRFQVLYKELAKRQAALRGSALNPTDAYGELQRAASPNVSNSQRALVTIVDLMGHEENLALKKYDFAKQNKVPYGNIERDKRWLGVLGNYQDEHEKIATGNPLMSLPSWYRPSSALSTPSEPVVPKISSTAAATAQNKPASSASTGQGQSLIEQLRARKEALRKQTQ